MQNPRYSGDRAGIQVPWDSNIPPQRKRKVAAVGFRGVEVSSMLNLLDIFW